MKYFIVWCAVLIIQINLVAQQYNKEIIDSLEKISLSETRSSYFAAMYKNAILKTNDQINSKTQSTKDFVIAFEKEFSRLFFKCVEDSKNGMPVFSNWKNYYEKKSLNKIQYITIGINAHINGDFWRALSTAHSYDSICKYRKELFSFQKSMNSVADSIYKAEKNYKRVNTLHLLTFGLDRKFSKLMVRKWRKRQIRFAMLSYTHEDRLKKKLKHLNNQMKRFDRFVIKWLR